MKKFRTVYYEIGKQQQRPPLTFAHLSDLHGCTYGEGQEILLSAIREVQPDAVMVSGDMITGKWEINRKTLAFFKTLAREFPVFYCNGNHETRYRERPEKTGNVYQSFHRALKKMGVFCLNNESMQWETKGRSFRVAGYEGDLRYYGRFSRKKPDLEELNRLLGRKNPEETTILLAHNPMYFPVYQEWGADLTFSGHLHGGYLRLPGIGGVITPQVQLFPKYDRGLFCEKEKYLSVSPGLGDHSISPRLFNPAEIIVIKWY
jgi:predicted MPP superfamily phosphohydrolase